MYTAAFLGNVHVVKLLLSLGVDPARAVVCHSAHGETRVALDAAAEVGHRDTSSAQFRFASPASHRGEYLRFLSTPRIVGYEGL